MARAKKREFFNHAASPPPACLQVAILIHFDFVSSQPISRNPAWQVPTVPPKRLSSIITLAHMQSRWWRRRQNVLGATGAFVSGPNRRCSTTLEQSPRAVVEQGFEIWRARYLKNDFVCINQAQIKPRARPAGTQAEETRHRPTTEDPRDPHGPQSKTHTHTSARTQHAPSLTRSLRSQKLSRAAPRAGQRRRRSRARRSAPWLATALCTATLT